MQPILIVEDEPAIAELIALTLGDAGFASVWASSGEEAADRLESGRYDLVLLDVMLPGADGFALLKYIEPTGTPVIFLTARGSVEDRVRGLRAGAYDYIVKPFAAGAPMAQSGPGGPDAAALRAVVLGDRVLLAALVRNLLLNAAASRPADSCVRVYCGAMPDAAARAAAKQGAAAPMEQAGKGASGAGADAHGGCSGWRAGRAAARPPGSGCPPPGSKHKGVGQNGVKAGAFFVPGPRP